MGEIADSMMSGLLCNGCGVYLGDDVGYPCYCKDCRKELSDDGEDMEMYPKHPNPKGTGEK